MAKNKFADFVEEEIDKKDRISDAKLHIDSELLKISTDFAGNPLDMLFNSKEIATIKEFLDYMRENHYKGANNLKLEINIPKKVLTLKEMDLGSSAYSLKKKLVNKVAWKKVWAGRGYPIGIVTTNSVVTKNSYNLVYLCTDLKLRITRTSPLFKDGQSKAAGVGTIPRDKTFFDQRLFRVGVVFQSYDRDTGTIFSFTQYGVDDYLKTLTKRIIIDD